MGFRNRTADFRVILNEHTSKNTSSKRRKESRQRDRGAIAGSNPTDSKVASKEYINGAYEIVGADGPF